ncbi:MAG: hypothetical protein ABI220_01175 [Candidatus Saccharimonadales bacterium]
MEIDNKTVYQPDSSLQIPQIVRNAGVTRREPITDGPVDQSLDELRSFKTWSDGVLAPYKEDIKRFVDEGTLLTPGSFNPKLFESHRENDSESVDIYKRYRRVRSHADKYGIAEFRLTTPLGITELHYSASKLLALPARRSVKQIEAIHSTSTVDAYWDNLDLTQDLLESLLPEETKSLREGAFDADAFKTGIRREVKNSDNIKSLIEIIIGELDSQFDTISPGIANGVSLQIYLLAQILGSKSVYGNVAQKLENIYSRHSRELRMDEREFDACARLAVNPEGSSQADVDTVQAIFKSQPQKFNDFFKLFAVDIVSRQLRVQKGQAGGISEIAQDWFVHSAKMEAAGVEALETEVSYNKYLIDYLNSTLGAGIEYQGSNEPSGDITSGEDGYNLDTMQLNWEILPEGDLVNTSREIVEDVAQRSGGKPQIDLSRLKVLEEARELWGKDQCYYTRGTRKTRSMVHSEDGAEQPDEYIILVLQEVNQRGEVTGEHAIAESPITERNALYVYRQDAPGSELGWRQVMSLTKEKSRALGAKQVKHTKADGMDLTSLMVEKIEHLLTCSPDEFSRLGFAGVNSRGEVRTRDITARTSVGQRAVAGALDKEYVTV